MICLCKLFFPSLSPFPPLTSLVCFPLCFCVQEQHPLGRSFPKGRAVIRRYHSCLLVLTSWEVWEVILLVYRNTIIFMAILYPAMCLNSFFSSRIFLGGRYIPWDFLCKQSWHLQIGMLLFLYFWSVCLFKGGKKNHFLHIALDKRIGCELATEQQQYWYDKNPFKNI